LTITRQSQRIATARGYTKNPVKRLIMLCFQGMPRNLTKFVTFA
jgi:hypothetical protein